ncbi:MAG: aminoacyl-tRNA hydrolase [Rhodothermales bacterium]|nr:aminoacyl-tRNA hydrolase [Rhodothermales bacterium]
MRRTLETRSRSVYIIKNITFEDLKTSERFILASGPGGQNVNKVATAVELRLDVDNSTALDEQTRARLKKYAGNRLTTDGELIIVARRYRSQDRNRQDARRRLADIIRKAVAPEKVRKRTRKPASAKRKRLDNKKKHSQKKKLRGKPPID